MIFGPFERWVRRRRGEQEDLRRAGALLDLIFQDRDELEDPNACRFFGQPEPESNVVDLFPLDSPRRPN